MAKRRLIEGLRSILQRQEDTVGDHDDDSDCLRQELLHLCNETDGKTYSLSLLYYCYYITKKNRNQKL